MMKKLFALFIFSAGFVYGFISHHYHIFPYSEINNLLGAPENPRPKQKDAPVVPPAGRWRKSVDQEGLDQIKENAEEIKALGYLSGHDPAGSTSGVLLHRKDVAFQGLNFYVSGHGPEAVLMNMDGKILHRWRYDYRGQWPKFKPIKGSHGHEYYVRAYLYENGDLLALFDDLGLIKLDKDSNLLWSYTQRVHHELFVMADGTIYTLTRQRVIRPEMNKRARIVEDFVTILTPDGKLIKNISILKALSNSSYAPVLQWTDSQGDILHTNTVEVLDGRFQNRSPFFKAGNMLICIRNMDLIAILDSETEKIVWALTGIWRGQHRPTFLDNGNILLFDNKGNNGKSKAMEFDPLTLKQHWEYTGTESRPLFSNHFGSCQRLSNGNTLITESDRGRVIEVTPDGAIVWEFLNPNRAGERRELIATICQMVRLRPDFPISWIKGIN